MQSLLAYMARLKFYRKDLNLMREQKIRNVRASLIFDPKPTFSAAATRVSHIHR